MGSGVGLVFECCDGNDRRVTKIEGVGGKRIIDRMDEWMNATLTLCEMPQRSKQRTPGAFFLRGLLGKFTSVSIRIYDDFPTPRISPTIEGLKIK